MDRLRDGWLMTSLVTPIARWLQSSAVGTEVAESSWLFPTIETVHIIAVTMVVGSIAMLDLRLLGVSLRHRSVIDVTDEILPWTWASFACAVVSGGLMFVSAAVKYIALPAFQIKMALLALAGLNMMIFHIFTYAKAHQWHSRASLPPAARVAGALSLLLWIGVVASGRWIGFAPE